MSSTAKTSKLAIFSLFATNQEGKAPDLGPQTILLKVVVKLVPVGKSHHQRWLSLG